MKILGAALLAALCLPLASMIVSRADAAQPFSNSPRSQNKRQVVVADRFFIDDSAVRLHTAKSDPSDSLGLQTKSYRNLSARSAVEITSHLHRLIESQPRLIESKRTTVSQALQRAGTRSAASQAQAAIQVSLVQYIAVGRDPYVDFVMTRVYFFIYDPSNGVLKVSGTRPATDAEAIAAGLPVNNLVIKKATK